MAYIGAAVLATALMAAALGPWHGSVAARTTTILVPTLTALAASGMSALRARWLPAERRIAWILLSLACLAWGLGGASWAVLELWQQRAVPLSDRVLPFPSVADVGFLMFMPPAVAALLVMVIGSTQATSRVRTFLDGLLITSALVFASYVVFLDEIVQVSASLDRGAFVIAMAYPVGDVLLLGMLMLVASRSVPQVRHTLMYLGAALVALTVADVGFWLQVAREGSVQGHWTHVGWLVGFALIGYAALRPIPEIPPHVVPRPGLWLSALPLAPFVVSTGLAMVVQVQRGALPPFLFWNAIVVVATLAVRQFVMVYENLQLRRETEASYARLQDAEALRTRLLHTITHDLQNPLSPIQIQLHLLENVPLDDATRRRIDLIGRNVEQIKRLTQDLGDVSKLQGGELRLLRADMDLAPVLDDVAESFQPIAHQRGLQLENAVVGILPVLADAIRLRQVVANLVSNALKFTPKDGRVVLAGGREGARVVVEVTDTGRGLTAEEVGRLFQPFSQVHEPNESPERGSGLGLFISRGLAQAHGGTLTVSSPGRGKGATFRLELPAVDLPPV